MPKKDKKKKHLEETHLKQNYVDENDLIPFLRDRFGEEFKIRVCVYPDIVVLIGFSLIDLSTQTLEDGSKMVEAPRKLSEVKDKSMSL